MIRKELVVGACRVFLQGHVVVGAIGSEGIWPPDCNLLHIRLPPEKVSVRLAYISVWELFPIQAVVPPDLLNWE